MKCRLCDHSIEPFLDFGRMPIANGFLPQEATDSEYFFELKVAFCEDCQLVQLLEQPSPEKMFHQTYPFFTGSSQKMKQHFCDFATELKRGFLASREKPSVLEIGSNDGTFLQNFQGDAIGVLGVEPSENVRKVCEEMGIKALPSFFNEKVAVDIHKDFGQLDLIVATNVMCHIPDLKSVVAGYEILLKADGLIVFEDPYLGQVIEKTAYDQIYDEHVFLFSLHAIRKLFEKYGFQVVRVEEQKTHGGSMRYYIRRQGVQEPDASVRELIQYEMGLGLDQKLTYVKFRRRCEKSRDHLIKVLKFLKEKGKRVAGYAATSKSTTVTNYCGITPEHLSYILDTTPMKQGKVSPGAHIPIASPERFQEDPPDYALLFGWNHKEEILAKEKAFTQAGGKWLVYVPKVEVLA